MLSQAWGINLLIISNQKNYWQIIQLIIHNNIPIINYVWNKIIRISILKQIPWYKVPNEDNLFSGILHSIGSLEFYNEYLYSYNERNNSISKSNNFSLDIVNKSIILLNNISKDKCKILWWNRDFIIICYINRYSFVRSFKY